MNCQRFEDIVHDIAHARIMEAGVRQDALAHSAQCESCATRFEDERAVTLKLRALAVSTESAGAPPRVEEQLLATFSISTVANARPMSKRRWQYSVSAAAAVLLIVFGFAAMRARRNVYSSHGSGAGAVANNDGPVRVSPQSANVPGPILSSIKNPERSSAGDGRHLNRRIPARHNGRGIADTTTAAANSANSEITTDFLPMTYGSTANLEDGGQLVRVELPRSAMATFGLPVNMDRANEKVKADVILGVDGLAHAIRFVR